LRLIAGGILLVCGLVPASIGAESARAEQRYRDEARIVRAQVVDKSMQPATSNSGTRYEVTYLAALPDASPVERTDAIDVSAWERLERGSELELQYLEDEPESIRIAREPEVVGFAVLFGIGAVLTSIGGVLAALGVRDVGRHSRLSNHGTPADATVVELEQTNVRINRRSQWRIRFTYRDHLGQERRGQSGYLSMADAHEWQTGDVGRVHFDRDRPELVLWLGEPTGLS
jgi:hypothetical protein